MESRDLVSVSRATFASLGLEGFRSRLGLEGYGLETLNISKKWFSKISIIQRFCLLYLQVRNKKSRKNARNLKKCNSEVMTIFFLIRQNAEILKSRVSVFVSNYKF